jgi:3-deoxy-D-manno-octulosonate 8-phosphate phosphatase (KDO 8-P phosphatase)
MPLTNTFFSNFPGIFADENVLHDAASIRFLILDVDGVCTDGKLYFQENGHPIKCFHSQDGIGIKSALRTGLGIGIITGRNDPCVHARMAQLGVTEYHAGFESKLPVLEAIAAKYELKKEEMAYMGDDWIDLDPLRSVGMPIAVANAVAQVKKEARYITAARGGDGAVREAIELLLYARMGGKNPADLWTSATGLASI